MTLAETLFRLQQRDVRIDALHRRKRDIEAATAEPASVLATRSAAADAAARLGALQTQLRDAELERQSLNGKITSEERRLYGGKVTNVKEMTSIESEIVSLRKRLARLDDAMLETMMRIEEAQSTQATTAARLANIEQRWATHLAGLREQLAAVETELGELTGQSLALRERLSVNDLALYDELRRKKGGRPVAPIERGRCGVCQVALPTANIDSARGPGLAFCNSCGRILVVGV